MSNGRGMWSHWTVMAVTPGSPKETCRARGSKSHASIIVRLVGAINEQLLWLGRSHSAERQFAQYCGCGTIAQFAKFRSLMNEAEINNKLGDLIYEVLVY